MDNDVTLTGQLESTNHASVSVFRGVGPEAPMVVNAQGGKQSDSAYRFDLLPGRALSEVAAVLKEGADKYGEWNWLKIGTNSHLNHSIVHAYAHLSGDRQEGEIGHLARHACRALFALEIAIREMRGEQA